MNILINYSHYIILTNSLLLRKVHLTCRSYALMFICQWSKRMYLCGFVAFSVLMSVAGDNKVEGPLWHYARNQ